MSGGSIRSGRGGGEEEDDDDPLLLSTGSKIAAELRSLFSLALPITAMNLLVYLRALVSVLCLGRLGPLPLAGGALSIGFTNITGYSVLFGLASGLDPLCSQSFGSRNWDLLSLSLQRTFLLLLAFSVPISLLWISVSSILVSLGQDPSISAVASVYCLYSLPDLVTNSFLQPLRVFLRSQGVTKPMAACSALAVLLHVPMSFLLASRFGVPGVAVAAVLTNLNMALLLLAYLKLSRACELTWRGWSWKAVGGLAPVVRLALPSCFGVCLEWWWYEIMTVLAGYLPDPTTAVAATAVLIQTTSLMYTFPMALAACVSTRVGNELGAGKPRRAKLAAMVALGCATVIGIIHVMWTVLFRDRWASLFTADASVVNLAASVLPLIGLCELGNCPQTVGCGVLRGTARPAVAARINLMSFYLAGTPVAVGLAFWLGLGFGGLWYGLLTAQVACVVSVLMTVIGRTDWDLEAIRAKKLTGSGVEGVALEEKTVLVGNGRGDDEV